MLSNDYYQNDSFMTNDSNSYQGIKEMFQEKLNDNQSEPNQIEKDDNSNGDADLSSSVSEIKLDESNEQSINADIGLVYEIDKLKEKMTFHISPEEIPRPKKEIEQFQSREGNIVYSTNIKEMIYHPNVNSTYTVNETQNSSIKLIRPSFHAISHSKDFLTRTRLKYGFCIEPFKDEPNIQSIEINPRLRIITCLHCGGYYTKHFISSHWKINDTEQNILIQCCLCSNQRTISSSDYIWNKLTQVSLDYLKPKGECVEYEVFAIDLSLEALKSNYSYYVIESIRNIIRFIGESYKRKACIMTIDEKEMCFYYFYKGNIRMIRVKDYKQPFIPLPFEALCIELKYVDIIFDAIHQQIAIKKQLMINRGCTSVNLLEVVLKSTVGSAPSIESESFFHVILFLFNPSGNKLTSPHDNFISNAQCDSFLKSNRRVSFDLFIASLNHFPKDNSSFWLQNYFNPNIIPHYYQLNPSKTDMDLQYEMLYYDLLNLISKQRYYNIQFTLITPIEFKANLLSPYPIDVIDQHFQLISSTNDLLISYEVEHKVKELYQKEYAFQFWMTYQSPNDSHLHHRVFSYKSKATSKISLLFSSIDISSLLPLIIHEEIRCFLSSKRNVNDSIDLLKKSVKDRLIKALQEYKSEIYLGNKWDSLAIPFSLTLLPLYLHSFTKLSQFRLFKLFDPSCYHNDMYCKLMSLLLCPMKAVSNHLYAQMLRIDKEEKEEIPLSVFYVEMNMGLLYDDGNTVTLYLMKGMKEDKFKAITNGCNWNDSNTVIKEAIVESLDNNISKQKSPLLIELRKRMDKAFNVEVIDDKKSVSNDFLFILKEDALFIGEESYESFIWKVKQSILDKFLTTF